MDQTGDANKILSNHAIEVLGNDTKIENTAQVCWTDKCPMEWEEETPAKFICRLCMKTFYNAKALQNHKNIQHDEDMTGSEGEGQNALTPKNIQDTVGLSGFKFIPLETQESYPVNTLDGLTTRTFSVDTSYLIVKVEEDDILSTAMKRSRIDGVVKRAQVKLKQTIDLRGPFTCTFPSTIPPYMQCRQIFFNCCDYSLHYREEHTKRRKAALRCQVCEKRLDQDYYSSNKMAVQSQTPNRFAFSCRPCSQNFMDSIEYDKHNRNVHAKMKPHQCSICEKRFTQQGGLQQHMRMHTGIRPFACTFCPKAFTQKAGLDQHLRTHTKIKPFKCVICGKCFSQSVHLRQHMRTHTNIQPFECSVCGRRFKQSSHLNFHLRSHGADGSVVMQNFNQEMPHDQMEFLNLANLQQVQDGDTLYYAAELENVPLTQHNLFDYSPQVGLSPDVLSLQ